MATIEKEKALDVVRQMVADGQVSQEVAERYFPELVESEDEKIRKWLIDTIKQVPNDSIEWETIDKSSVLAWLEKQVEQKSLDDVAKEITKNKETATGDGNNSEYGR